MADRDSHPLLFPQPAQSRADRPKEEHAGPWRTFPARCTLCGMACQLVVPVDPVVVRTRWECARCLQIAMAEVRE